MPVRYAALVILMVYQYHSTGMTWQGMAHDPALGLCYSSMSRQQQQQRAAALQAMVEIRVRQVAAGRQKWRGNQFRISYYSEVEVATN